MWWKRARAVALGVSLVVGCADGAPPRIVRPTPTAPTAASSDAGAVAQRPRRAVPAEPTDEFPYVGIFDGYVQAFREEQVDEEWAKRTEATLKSQLTALDPNVVRVRLLECRCGLCVLGYIIAPGGEGPDPQPGVDLPAVRWSGYEKHMRGSRADGWVEVLALLGRHPSDSPRSSPQVRSTDSPWEDPACKGSVSFSPAWGSSGTGLNWSGFGINRMYLTMATEKVCPCLCGKLRSDARPACLYRSGGHVFCRLTSFTPRGLPIIEGDWSCKQTDAGTPQ